MKVNQQHYRTIWADVPQAYVEIINQTVLPFKFEVVRMTQLAQMVTAIISERDVVTPAQLKTLQP